MTDDRRGAANPVVDIKALLRVALDQGPRDDVQERVLGRMVTMTTIMEFARLIFVAPVQWIIDEHLRGPAHDGEEEEHAGVDE